MSNQWEYEDEEAADYEWEYGSEEGEEEEEEEDEEEKPSKNKADIPLDEQDLPDPFSPNPVESTTQRDVGLL